MGNQLLSLFVLRDEVVVHEGDQAIRMRIILVLKVETVVHFANPEGLLVRVMLQYELLEVEESALVVNSLSDLHLGDPRVWSVGLLAIVTLQV